ncbi:hypothetical protein K8R62_03185 [bacterium]|nr:hypothetical protein [bacterium]
MTQFIGEIPRYFYFAGSYCGFGLFFSLFLLVDDYKYPLCPECGDNLGTKRKKGRKYCKIHGFF